MDIAKEIYDIGKEKLVTAKDVDEINKITISFTEKRFFCPVCGEYVTFVKRNNYKSIKENGYKSFFRHTNKNELDCELRVNYRHEISIYERTGLPLYLRRINNDIFELCIGFYKIDKIKLDKAESEKYMISVGSNKKESSLNMYYINDTNFSTESYTLKKIDFIASVYKINYIPDTSGKLFSNLWGHEVEGIPLEGALFAFGENGGKKIKINDEITADKKYYYLGKNEIIFDHINCVTLINLGTINLNANNNISTYNIYVVEFQCNSEEEILTLSNFIRDKFKVSLILKTTEFINMWPPVVNKDSERMFVNERDKQLSILDGREELSNIYMHYTTEVDEFTAERIDINKYYYELPMNKFRVPVSIDAKYNPIFAIFNRYEEEIVGYSNNIEITDIDDKVIEKGLYFQLPRKKSIYIKTESRCKVLHLNKNNYSVYNIKDSEKVAIKEISFNDKIILLDTIDNIRLIEYVKQVRIANNTIDDNELYINLMRCYGYKIPIEPWHKQLLLNLVNYPKSFNLIKRFILNNEITISASKILKEIYSKGVSRNEY